MAEKVPDKPLDPATRSLLAQQLVMARASAMQYPTVPAATAAGYHLVGGGFGPGSGAHYIGGFSMGFDPSHPLALIYDGINPSSQMVGLMYYAMGNTAPEGFAGPKRSLASPQWCVHRQGWRRALPARLERDRGAVHHGGWLLYGHHGLDGARVGGAGLGKPGRGVLAREPGSSLCRRHVPHRHDRALPRVVTDPAALRRSRRRSTRRGARSPRGTR